VPFVQLVIPDYTVAGPVTFNGQIQTVVGSTITNNSVAGIVLIPEPASGALLSIAVFASLVRPRRRARE
jgi:hypothetical protein